MVMGNGQILDGRMGQVCEDDSQYSLALDVRASVHSEGLVLLHIGTGLLFTSNAIGAIIWQSLADQRRLEALGVDISAEFSVPLEQVEKDVVCFISDLERHGFVQRNKAAECPA